MARDGFIFYRSFLEAIKCMPSDVQAEIYPAIVEYALNGKEPKGLSDIAKGVFILIKPVMDANNARSEGGKKGKKFGKLGGRPAKDRAVSSAISDKPNVTPGYTLTLEQEIEEMRADRSWNEPVCMQFHIREDELGKRLDSFLNHCRCEYEGKPHDNINDAKRHFCSWMRKAYTSHAEPEDAQELPPPSYEFNGGFGGQDV